MSHAPLQSHGTGFGNGNIVAGTPEKDLLFNRGIHDDITKTAAPLPGVTSIKNKQHQGAQNTRLKNQAHTHKEMFMGLEELIEFSKEIFVAVLL